MLLPVRRVSIATHSRQSARSGRAPRRSCSESGKSFRSRSHTRTVCARFAPLDGGSAMANVNLMKPGGAPYRMSALLVAMPAAGDTWQVVAANYGAL